MNMMNTISNKPLIIDYSDMSHEGFMHFHVNSILNDSNDISKGVNGICKAGAFGRLAYILATHGASEPKIIKVINDPEVELSYVIR